MSDNTPDVPPWEPIADWLARIKREKGNGTEFNGLTQNQIRDRFEVQAKAIAYDMATYDETDS